MKFELLTTAMLLSFIALNAQNPSIPRCAAEDKEGSMSPGYWAVWNEAEQARIDKDIDTYRKADAVFKTGRVKKGTTVKVEQLKSKFIFGASAFNWNQLGDSKSNAIYRELFGGLFNRATIPFYWNAFEIKPGVPRYETQYTDTEEYWNTIKNPTKQTQWRRPPSDQIVDWCQDHGIDVHGHPLVWGNRSQYPLWIQYEGLPLSEKRALDSLEILDRTAYAKHVGSYDHMNPDQIAALVPTFIKNQELLLEGRIREIMGRYQGRISSYDVVNESACDFGTGSQDPSFAMCKSRYGIMPADYTFRAFKIAESCNDGGALLNINDYTIDSRQTDQLKHLQERGAKIDVIGSQMHLFQPQQCADIANGEYDKIGAKLVTPAAIRPYFEKLGSYGIPTCLSEITITSAGEGAKGEMIQAIITRDLYRLWFSLPSMMGITWWNIVDECGAAGEPVISGLFHRDMTPKTAYFALDQLINHEWRTNMELKPDSKGRVCWRGFRGEYSVSWTDPSGKTHVERVTIE